LEVTDCHGSACIHWVNWWSTPSIFNTDQSAKTDNRYSADCCRDLHVKRPQLGAVESLKHSPAKQMRIGSIAAGGIGFYDGLIGPGTGSFLILILVAVLGFAFLQASAMAKVINLCTNVGAILVFGLDGSILWKVGLLLAVANVAGGLIGATLAIRGGSTFVRKIFLFITTALIFKVGLDTITMW